MPGMRYQPQGLSRIKPEWRRRGLAFAWVASNPSQNIANANAVDLRIGKLVYAASPRGIGASGFQPPISSNILIQDQRITGFSGTGTFVSGGVYSGSGGMMSIGTSGQGVRIGINSNSGLTYMGVADYYNGPAPAAGPIVLGVSISPGSALVTLKDVNRIASSTISISAPAATSEPLRMGTTGVSDVWPGSLEFGFYFTSTLSADELRQLVNNPWALFESVPSSSAYQAAIATTAPTVTNATGAFSSAIGQASMAASGKVVNVGMLASAIANSSLSASGAVSPAPSGALASSLANASMIASGGLLDVGSLAAIISNASMSASGSAAMLASGAYSATMANAGMYADGYLGSTAPVAHNRRYRWRVLRRFIAS